MVIIAGISEKILAQAPQQRDTTVITVQNDTLLLRKTRSEWRFGTIGSFGAGASTGRMWLPADLNSTSIRAAFGSIGMGNTSDNMWGNFTSWQIGAETSLALNADGIRLGGSISFLRQQALLGYTPPNTSNTSNTSINEPSQPNGNFSALQSLVQIDALRTGFHVQSPSLILPCLHGIAGADILWRLQAFSQTNFVRNGTTAISIQAPSQEASVAFPALGIWAGFGYKISLTDKGSLTSLITPRLTAHWQPVIASSQSAMSQSALNEAASLGAWHIQLGVSIAFEPLRSDTLSAKPLLRLIPIQLLAETPLAAIIREDETAVGRTVSPSTGNEAILEERVLVYRQDDTKNISNVPPEAIELLRSFMPLLRTQGTFCRLSLIIPAPANSDNSGALRAEQTLRILGDYLLRRNIEETSIEAGFGENRYTRGEAWQLRIQIARNVR